MDGKSQENQQFLRESCYEMNGMGKRISFPIPDVEVSYHDEDIMNISFSILEILESCLMII